MAKRVLIIGGYGNFGGTIAKALAPHPDIQLIIAGRSLSKASHFIKDVQAKNSPEAIQLDIHTSLTESLALAVPDLVIHTTGPFQDQDYTVARACMAQGCHYIDIADARRFVVNISALDKEATSRNILLMSGASSVPCLTAAVIDYYLPRFSVLQKVEYGISATQQTNRGLATTSAILSYVGKPFTTLIKGKMRRVFGWQNLHAVNYPDFGWRFLGNCDIPDLDIFPARYPSLKTVRFSAGHEITFLHIGLWFLSWLVRLGFIPSLQSRGEKLLKLSFLFDRFGKWRSAFHMFLSGKDKEGGPRKEKFFILARSGHGPFIPCMPAILIARGFAEGRLSGAGARPCLDMIDLKTYLTALKDLDIEVIQDHEEA
jgi:saccharopine dehydrogenase-like NADP-dependent oxidoreductase